ncbi:MAG: hypothetical protein HY298_06250 [Verrucomicrobia bacterium]|nr:hypothetical protein [Verrucomicrobiota bacterium]
MPIRLNLLSEAQALEELRRRDPVKRAMWGAGVLVAGVVIWCVLLQIEIMRDNEKLSGLETKSKSQESQYQQVINNKKKLEETEEKVAKLRQLASNRFLIGNPLNALQRTTVDEVQLVHLKVMQQYILNAEVKDKTNDTRVIKGKPASVTEKITLVLDGKDFSPRAEQLNKFKETLANSSYFQEALGKTNDTNIKLTSLSSPQIDSVSGKLHVLFTLECRYPDKTR